MARTLIIKNADFSVNKLATVEIEEEIPCTGITLSKNTSAITHLGDTDTLTATVAPVDTTDAVVWTSSNSNVATVAGGVITATGCGTATITATCGDFSATCAVTVTHIATLQYGINIYFGKSSNKDYLDYGDLSNYAVGYSTSGNYIIASGEYPFVIPNGANKINISAQGFRPYGFWMSSTEHSTAGNVAFAYPADDNFKYNGSVVNSRIVPIPDSTSGTYEGVDACVFVFGLVSGTISESDVEAIVITFYKDESN